MKKNKDLIVLEHPLISHLMLRLRDKNTDVLSFRHVINQLCSFIAHEVAKDFKTRQVEISTPMEKVKGRKIVEELIIVGIMRAGSILSESLLQILPFAKMGHIGIYRDKFIQNTVEYFFRLPSPMEGRRILLADLSLATGHTAIAAIDRLKDYQVGPIHFACLLASPKGIKKLHEVHPDVQVITFSVERALNKDGLLLPGLGDGGERLFGAI